MKKQEFITRLRYKLTGVPETDVLERIGFISEVIDDKVEEGYTEDDAVRELGSPDEVASRIIAEVGIRRKPIKPSAYSEEKQTKRGLSALAIVLIALGSPIWISLALAALALIISAYAVIWSVVASLWAAFGSLVAAGFGGILASAIMIFTNPTAAFACFGCALFALGLTVPMFYGCLYTTKGAAWASKQIALGIKNIFARR